MHRLGKQVEPEKLRLLQRDFYNQNGYLETHVNELRDEHSKPPPEYRSRDPFWKTHRWPYFISAGYSLAEAIIGTLRIPPGKAKQLEIATRLFITTPRYPRDLVSWYDANYKKINFLYDAAEWEPKGDEREDEQKFKLGPFTVHNTLGLSGNKLDGVKDTLLKVISKAQHMPLPEFGKALYGEIYLVGRLRKTNVLAWYNRANDIVYARPFTKYREDFAQTMLHELCHRYWDHTLARDLKTAWQLWHLRVSGSTLVYAPATPKPGDIIELNIQGYKGVPKVHSISVQHGKLMIMLGEPGTDPDSGIAMNDYRNVLLKANRQRQFPTTYSAKNQEEHFCEAASLIALGELKEPHKDAFLSIFVRKAGAPAAEVLVSKTASLTGTFVFEETRYRWKKEAGSRTRGLGQDPPSWSLLDSTGHMIAHVGHSYHTGYNPHPEPDAWRVFIRLPTTPEETAHGKKEVHISLKAKFPGDANDFSQVEPAQRLAERALIQFSAQRKTKTAGTYVQISRDDLEEWLDSLPTTEPARLKEGKVGVYLLPLSDVVGVQLSSTIGSRDDAMGRGEASMRLALVSLVTGQVLNKKAMGQSHFNRTTNWQRTWRTGFDRMRDAYLQSQGFYDALAPIKDREKYQKEILGLINGIPDWENNSFLRDMNDRVAKGGILTVKQREAVENAAKRAPKPSAREKPPFLNAKPQVDPDYIKRLDTLIAEAQRVGDQWLISFLRNVVPAVKSGRPLSGPQEGALERNLSKYRVASLYRNVIRRLL